MMLICFGYFMLFGNVFLGHDVMHISTLLAE